MNKNPIIPVILCGGSGSRLWPLSRKSFPKQYLNIDLEDDFTLLQSTQRRISSLKNTHNPILICNEDHRFIVAEQMKRIDTIPKCILLEPFGRNTAPAVTLAALKALENELDPILLIMSSDHRIKNEHRFIETITKGVKHAINGRLVTFGIKPNAPETGYGYIELENELNSSNTDGENIKNFKEKPTLDIAKKFIKENRYLWNSGIFLFKAKSYLKELKKYNNDIVEICKDSLSGNLLDLDFQRLNKEIFDNCPNTSIDVAVMEKTNLGTVLPLDVGWSDIGSWESLWQISKKNKDGNSIFGKVISKDTKDCYLRSENRLLVTIGIDNLIVIETSDAILISEKSKSQELKNTVEYLEKRGIKEGQEHKKIYRPWGHYISVVEQEKWQVKLINVKPGEMLSLQKHRHRSEHWVVVSGKAKVIINNEEKILSENQSTYIPLGAVHRLMNPGKLPLILIEVQSGSYIGEDDIERFEDNYGRIEK